MSCGVNEILMFSSLPAQVCGIAIGQCGFRFFFGAGDDAQVSFPGAATHGSLSCIFKWHLLVNFIILWLSLSSFI